MSLDTRIKHEDQKLKDMLNDPSYTQEQRGEVRDRLSDLKEERKTLLDSDTSLAEKIRIIFRERGIVLGAIIASITALAFIIDKIVNTFSGSSSGSGGEPPPQNEQGVKKWIKDKLKALARLLGKLAEKAAAALPGIIGSVVSWLLNTLKKVVSFAAEHVWAFIVFVVGLVFTYITKKSHLKK